MPAEGDRIRFGAGDGIGRTAAAAWHCAVAALIAAPLVGRGALLLLDFTMARRVAVRWWPVPSFPRPVNTAPAESVIWLLAKLGGTGAALLVFALFVTMGLGANLATRRLLNPSSRLAPAFAGTLYAVNPFVYDRLMHGQMLVLAGYAITPLALLAFARLWEQPSRRAALGFGALFGGIAWTSLHHLVMVTALLAVYAAVDRPARGAVRWTAGVAAALLVANAWWIAGLAVQPPGRAVGHGDLAQFATQPVGPASLGNVAAMYGFWRHEFRLAKDGVSGWWLVLIPIAALASAGAVAGLRDARRRPVVLALLIVVPVAVFLGSGTSFSPTRGAFLWIYDHVPGFKIFREPQKWAALLPLAYGMTGALGLEALRDESGQRSQSRRIVPAAAAGIALLLPLVYSWTLVANFDRLHLSRFPADWFAADEHMLDAGGGTLLFLPWHLYLTFPFTGHRVVNPAPAFFSVSVDSGDNAEIGPLRSQSTNSRSKTIENALFNPESREEFTRHMNALCVRWIALAKAADHESYAWISSTPGLERAFDGRTLTLWRVRGPCKGVVP